MWYPFFMDKRTQLLRVATLQEEERKFIDEACIASGLQKAVFLQDCNFIPCTNSFTQKSISVGGITEICCA